MIDRTALWSLLDGPGADHCRFTDDGGGLTLDGAALWRDGDMAARLSYRVRCDAEGRTRSARVEGWAGVGALSLEIARSDAGWSVNGAPAGIGPEALDVDLGFTPATNTLAMRRQRLAPGASASGVAAWLDLRDWRLKPLRQGYARLGPTAWRYDSPDNGYSETLEVDADGVVALYPDLWRLER